MGIRDWIFRPQQYVETLKLMKRHQATLGQHIAPSMYGEALQLKSGHQTLEALVAGTARLSSSSTAAVSAPLQKAWTDLQTDFANRAFYSDPKSDPQSPLSFATQTASLAATPSAEKQLILSKLILLCTGNKSPDTQELLITTYGDLNQRARLEEERNQVWLASSYINFLTQLAQAYQAGGDAATANDLNAYAKQLADKIKRDDFFMGNPNDLPPDSVQKTKEERLEDAYDKANKPPFYDAPGRLAYAYHHRKTADQFETLGGMLVGALMMLPYLFIISPILFLFQPFIDIWKMRGQFKDMSKWEIAKFVLCKLLEFVLRSAVVVGLSYLGATYLAPLVGPAFSALLNSPFFLSMAYNFTAVPVAIIQSWITNVLAPAAVSFWVVHVPLAQGATIGLLGALTAISSVHLTIKQLCSAKTGWHPFTPVLHKTEEGESKEDVARAVYDDAKQKETGALQPHSAYKPLDTKALDKNASSGLGGAIKQQQASGAKPTGPTGVASLTAAASRQLPTSGKGGSGPAQTSSRSPI